MDNPFILITQTLEGAGIEYGLLEHEPVHTSEEAAKVRGMSQTTGAKSLLLKGEHGYVVAVIQGSERLDIKKLMRHLGVNKKPRFANPDEVQQQLNCQVGACYPLAGLQGVRTVLDGKFLEQETMSFNPGVHNKTVIMDVDDFVQVAEPEVAALT